MASGTRLLNVLLFKFVFSCIKVLVISNSMKMSHFSLAFLVSLSNRRFISVPLKSLERAIFLLYFMRVSPSRIVRASFIVVHIE